MVIPHGVYDVGRNQGFLHLNTSRDTSELACDSIAAWWEEHGRTDYPRAKKLLVLCDGGGSNSAARYVFKEELQKLANRLGHRDPHRPLPALLLQVQSDRAPPLPPCDTGLSRGDLRTLEVARYYMAKTETSTGLKVDVSVLDKVYQTGRKCAAGFKESMKIAFDKLLPKWNYRAVPQPT